MSSIRLRCNTDIGQILMDKLKVVDSPEVRTAINQVYADMCDPYVPYDMGALANTAQVTDKGVTYTQPYARRQYFGEEIHHKTEYHPLATARWNEVMLADHGDEFIAEASQIIRRAFRKGEG